MDRDTTSGATVDDHSPAAVAVPQHPLHLHPPRATGREMLSGRHNVKRGQPGHLGRQRRRENDPRQGMIVNGNDLIRPSVLRSAQASASCCLGIKPDSTPDESPRTQPDNASVASPALTHTAIAAFNA
jgi:hypothetical protein